MKITITPDNPMIFLGQKFTLQVNINDCATKILWISAQIAGKVKSLKNSTESIIQELVHDSLGIVQSTPFFGHVMSGSRLIANNFHAPKTFCAELTADEIPPSYEGEGISITYELRFAVQLVGKPVDAISIPIRLVGNYNSSTILAKSQQMGKFEINAVESNSLPAPFSLASPFNFNANNIINEYKITNGSLKYAVIKMGNFFHSGTEVTGVIKVIENIKEVEVRIKRDEFYKSIGLNEISVISSSTINLENIIMKRFNIPLTFQTVSNFSTEIINVKYIASFKFKLENDVFDWEVPIHIYPPLLSLSTQRTPVNSIQISKQ